MFPYELYKVIHFIGIFLLLMTLSALMWQMFSGGQPDFQRRKHLMIGHGVAMFFILLGGMGMLARLGIGFPAWVWIKLAIWLVFGGIVAVIRRKPQWSNRLWVLILALAVLAAMTAIYKPLS
jgi:hypothetical protein